MAFVHSVGNGPSLNSLLKYLTRNGTRESSAAFKISLIMPSGPAAFPFFRCVIAALTSSAVMSASRISSKTSCHFTILLQLSTIQYFPKWSRQSVPQMSFVKIFL